MLKIIRTDAADKDFQELVGLLDADLRIRDGEDHVFYSQFNKLEAIGFAVVGFLGETAVACGAFKEYGEGTVEIKRMYVRPDRRGRGFGFEILRELENRAKELGYTTAVLETGKKQPEAIRLYQKSGYRLIPNYGQYAGVENSVCMKKTL